MKKATIFTHPILLKNKQFDYKDPFRSPNGDLYLFHLLRTRLAEHGYDLGTQDVHPPENSDFVLFNEMPTRRVPTRGARYLLLFESEVIRPDNWDLARHHDFDRIFTWNDAFLDGRKYFKINFTRDMKSVPPDAPGERDKFCVVIAGNKYVRPHPLELYSRRIEAIRWFERNHPADFDLYGIGWEAPLTLKSIAKAFLYGRPSYIFSRRFPSYHGAVQDKIATLRRYKFSICFENARGIPGYITEKIMDCILAGCVPVYWGAPNIDEHVPARAFVDFRNFKSYEELHRYLKGMSEGEYRGYRDAAAEFTTSAQARRFSNEFFADQVLNAILEDQTRIGSR